MIKILIDPGHGEGKNFNRGGIYFNEGDNNFHYSLVLKKELEKYEGVVVDLTRIKISDNPSLQTRANMGKDYDLFLSNHSNAANGIARGSEVWDSVEKPNKVLAQDIVDATAKCFNHANRGVKYKAGQPGFNWYGVLRFNEAKSSMIIENGFHDNSLDCAFFRDNHHKIAVAQAKVITNHYKLKLREDNIAITTPNVNLNTPSNWAKEAWTWGVDYGVCDGNRPQDTATREEIVTMLHRVLNK